MSEGKKRILIADDTELFRLKLKNILSNEGYQTCFAQDGEEAIKILKGQDTVIDLLILDLYMPKKDGFAVLEWIRGDKKLSMLPTLVVTGIYVEEEVEERIKRLGATGFITKWFTPEELLMKVNKILYPNKRHIKSPRILTHIPVEITTKVGSFSGFIENLSKTGASISTDKNIETGELIQLRFLIPEEGVSIDVGGEVVWVERIKKGYRIGVIFKELSSKSWSLINSLIISELDRLYLQSNNL